MVMTNQTGEWLLKSLQNLNEVEPVADFGGGRTRKRISKILKRVGVDKHTVYDIKGGDISLDLVKDSVKEKYQTIICADTLEHVTNPFNVARNIYTGLQEGGIGLITAPFHWKKHGNDYFRFSKEGLLALFDDYNIEEIESFESKDKGFIRSYLIIKKL